MSIIYEEITDRGLQIPLAICKLAKLSDRAVINVFEGRIEVQSLEISKERAEMMANRHIILHLGDSLVAGEGSLLEDEGGIIWKVPVFHSRTGEKRGELYLSSESGAVLRYEPTQAVIQQP